MSILRCFVQILLNVKHVQYGHCQASVERSLQVWLDTLPDELELVWWRVELVELLRERGD